MEGRKDLTGRVKEDEESITGLESERWCQL